MRDVSSSKVFEQRINCVVALFSGSLALHYTAQHHLVGEVVVY